MAQRGWLFNVTATCNEWDSGGWDNDSTTIVSRVFLITFYLLLLAAVFALSRVGSLPRSSGKASRNDEHLQRPASDLDPETAEMSENSSSASSENSSIEVSFESSARKEQAVETTRPEKSRERMWHLDFARIVCVACVVMEHSGGSQHYTLRNTFFVLQWVLPFLYLTSGICFMLSSASVPLYTLRLSIVLLVGVSANWIADIITGRDWQSNFGDTIFQMFYVVMLIIMAFCTAPLRQSLRWRSSKPGEKAGGAIWTQAVIFGLLTIVGFGFYLSGQPIVAISETGSGWSVSAAPVLNQLPLMVVQIGSLFLLCSLALLLGGASDLFGWILLAAIYVPRVVIPWTNVGYAHNVELYIFAMVTHVWKLQGSDTVAKYARAYWPLLFAIAMMFSMPSLTGRCDLDPAETYLQRFRFYSVECGLTVAFTTGVFNTSDPLGMTVWLNCWALYAYCFHVAWYRLLPAPYGACWTYGSVFIFFAIYCAVRKLRASGGKRGQVGLKASVGESV